MKARVTLLSNDNLCVLSDWYIYTGFFIIGFFLTLAGWDAYMLSYRSIGEDVCIVENLSQEACTLCSIIVVFLSQFSTTSVH